MNYISLQDFKRLKNSAVLNLPDLAEQKKSIRGISIDSRTIQPGEIFWSLKGENFDGHNFVIDAFKKGAVAAVISKEMDKKFSGLHETLIVVDDTLNALQILAAKHRRKYHIPVIAITGTNGKTTTKEMIAWILQKKFTVHKTKGNLNNHIGTPLTVLQLKPEHQVAIFEIATNHPGEIDRLCKIVKPNAGLITNIGRGHLQYFSSIEGVAREKIHLFKNIKRSGIIFLNLDDKRLLRFSYRYKTVWSYSPDHNRNANVTGTLIKMNKQGESIWLLNNRTKITLNVPGIHNFKNALAASAVALYFGIREEDIKSALESYSSYEKRMQIIQSDKITFINDCYNANPDSFFPAFQTLEHISEQQKRRKVVIMGDMLELGLESVPLHEEIILELLNYDIAGIFTLGNDSKIAADLLREKGYEHIYSFSTHEDLAIALKKFIKSNDIVLLKGSRGMQMEKVLSYI
jgi:UDP-N-acetylmuramoyl-tripeptide--D-alanyl-D-alanine ligase